MGRSMTGSGWHLQTVLERGQVRACASAWARYRLNHQHINNHYDYDYAYAYNDYYYTPRLPSVRQPIDFQPNT